MAITGNRNYNDPALGAAFGNLASLFAPPGGADLAGYATANAKNEEAQRLAELFAAGLTPSEKAALTGVAAYGSTPQGFTYKTDQDNATQRYGYDTSAATSRANNEADNAAALAQLYATPVLVNEGQTAFLPQQTQEATGLPGMFTGAVSTQPGERVTLPGGQVVEGAPKPMTEDELRAQLLSGMPAAQQNAWAFGNTPLESVIMDGQPTYTTRPEAIGQQPVPSASGGTPRNYVTPDGQRGTTLNGIVDAATGLPLPAGTQTFNTALQGGQTETGLAPTTANQTEANKVEATLNAMDADIDAMASLLQNNPGIAGAPGAIRGVAQNFVTSVGEVIAAYSAQAPDAMMTLEQAQGLVQQAAPGPRDPAIAQFNVQLANMAYRLAQMNNPSGEVSRQAYERAMESLTGGMFANNASTLEALGAMKQQVARNREQYLGTLRQPGQPVPSGAAPQDSGIPTVATPEEARMLPSGTRFRDPNGNIRVVP